MSKFYKIDTKSVWMLPLPPMSMLHTVTFLIELMCVQCIWRQSGNFHHIVPPYHLWSCWVLILLNCKQCQNYYHN